MLHYITVSSLSNIPKGVLVAKSRTGRVKILPRKIKGKLLKEQIVEAPFDNLFNKGVIRVTGTIPSDLKSTYEGVVA